MNIKPYPSPQPAIIRLATWLGRHSLEIAPLSIFEHSEKRILEADISITTFACPPRIDLVEGHDFYNKSERHRVTLRGALLDLDAIEQFCDLAHTWLQLPIEELGTTYFHDTFDLGINGFTTLRLRIKEYDQTPRKTDWMTVVVAYVNGEDYGEKAMHIDYTCLQAFVSDWDEWLAAH